MGEASNSPPLPIRRNDDGGYGPVDGAPSEPEATALVALAYDDGLARQWLLADQAADGSLALRAGSVTRDETALGALALDPGPSRERALDHVVAYQGHNGDDPYVHAFGWPWTEGAHGWTEPTAWGLLALRTLRPSATDRIADALAFFQERECAGGGWNYGSSVTLGVDLPPYVQTTAIALLGLGDRAPALAERGTRGPGTALAIGIGRPAQPRGQCVRASTARQPRVAGGGERIARRRTAREPSTR